MFPHGFYSRRGRRELPPAGPYRVYWAMKVIAFEYVEVRAPPVENAWTRYVYRWPTVRELLVYTRVVAGVTVAMRE
jgi:hypothetical protein